VGARFSAPVQNGHGSHPTSYAMGTGSFSGVNRPERGVDHPPPPSTEVKERVDLYLYSPSGPSWPVIGLTFTFTVYNRFMQPLYKVSYSLLNLLFGAIHCDEVKSNILCDGFESCRVSSVS